jgi:hypothetical protein
MEIIVFILIIAVLYLWYHDNKTTKLANQNYKLADQNSTMVLTYAQMLYTLMEQKKFTEKDYLQLVTAMWEVDSNLGDEMRDFNPKWEKICLALDIKPQYDDNSKYRLSSKNIEAIATKLYRNRHLFQQYIEESNRSKKISERIMNDPKHNY